VATTIFDTLYAQGPPTQEKAYKSLLQHELQCQLHESTANKSVGITHFVNDGLRLEHDQCIYNSLFAKPLAHIRNL
jgi:hypothetical protein